MLIDLDDVMYRLEREQTLPISRTKCWEFFSDPRNLPTITPPWLDFTVLQDGGGEFYEGLILQHRVRPFFGLTLRWVTEITHVEPGVRFVDEQRFGPYKFWHHQHVFRERGRKMQVIDLVHYLLPFGPLGSGLHRLLVQRRLQDVFDFRRAKLTELFGD